MLPDSSFTGSSRRTVLRSAILALGIATTSGALSACEGGYAGEPDPLLPLLRAARADTTTAENLASSQPDNEVTRVARAVARVRDEHAGALRAEIERRNRPRPQQHTTTPPRMNGLPDLAPRLEGARDEASSLVPGLPTYRAGLVGSIAAGCAGLQQLTPKLETEGAASAAGIAVHPVSTGELESEAQSALRKALASEYAAVWIYGLVTAFLPAAFDDAIEDAQHAHRQARDSARDVLAESGTQPPAPASAYVPDEPVNDETSAVRLVVTAEEDVARSWRGVLVRTDDRALRKMATRGLVTAATRAARWHDEAGGEADPVALPGAP